MNDPEGFYKILRKDQRNDVFKKVINGIAIPLSLQDLYDIIDKVDLIENVPDTTKGIFKIAKKLFVLAYFEYSLFTVSAHYCFLAVEAAIGHKYQQQYTKPAKNLGQMLNELLKDRILSVDKADVYDACRRLRNELSHLTTQKILMPGMVPIARTAELINELFA